jgi:peptide chain release factor subunit 1
MAGSVTWSELRELASVEASEGLAISLYVDLDPSVAATAGDVRTRVNSLLDTAGKVTAAQERPLSHAQRIALRGDLDRIRGWFEQEFVRDGARGVAVFCGSLDGIWRTRPILASVGDEISLDRRLALAPLARLVGRDDGALVVVAGRERGRFLRLADGRLTSVADLTEEQPGRHDQGGWSQSRFQRHIDELASEHLRDVAEELDRRVRGAGGEALDLVIVASEESRAELAGYLTRPVREALAGWAQAEAHTPDSELHQIVEPVLATRRAAREAELLERWREASAKGRGVGGWEATLEAVSDSRAETLLLAERAQADVWRCPSCGRLATEAGDCPIDGDETTQVDSGADAAIVEALRRGGSTRIVSGPDLGPVEGIGALLRF